MTLLKMFFLISTGTAGVHKKAEEKMVTSIDENVVAFNQKKNYFMVEKVIKNTLIFLNKKMITSRSKTC